MAAPRTQANPERALASPPATQTEGAKARRAEIVAKAAELFERNGYHQTSLTTIAQAVGLRKPTLYHYFASKEEILAAIHDDLIDLLVSSQKRRAALRLPARDELGEIMRQNMSLIEFRHDYLRVFFEHERELSPERCSVIVQKRAEYQEMVVDVIVRGVRTGEFREVHPTLAALALFGACNWAYHWYRDDAPLSGSDIAQVFWDIFFRGLSPQSIDGRDDAGLGQRGVGLATTAPGKEAGRSS